MISLLMRGLPDFWLHLTPPVPLYAGFTGALLRVYLQGLWLSANAPFHHEDVPLLFLSPLIPFFSEVSFQLISITV